MPINITTRQNLASFQRAAELAGSKPLELRNAGKENERLAHPKWQERVVQFIRSIGEKLRILRPDPTRAQRQEAAKDALIRLLDTPGSHPAADFMQQRASGTGLTGNEVLALLTQARQSAEGKEALAEVQRLVSAGFYPEPEVSRDSAAGLADSGLQEPVEEHQENLPERDASLTEKIPEALRSAYEQVERERNANLAAAAKQDTGPEQQYENVAQQGARVYENATQQGTGPGTLYENAPAATDETYEDMQPQTDDVYEDTLPATRKRDSALPEPPPEAVQQEAARAGQESAEPEQVYASVLPRTRERGPALPKTPPEAGRRETTRAGDETDVKAQLRQMKGIRNEVRKQVQQSIASGKVSGRDELTRLINEKTAAWVQNNRIGQWYAEGLDKAGLSAPRHGTVPEDLVGMIMDSIENHDGLYGYDDVKSESRKIIHDYLQAAPSGR